MSVAEFGSTTPRLFDAYCDRMQIERRNQYFGHGIVASLIANVYRDANKHPAPFLPSDFVPGYKGTTAPKTLKDMTPQEQLAYISQALGRPEDLN